LSQRRFFFEISIDREVVGVINFDLYKETPRTSLNFGLLCDPKKTNGFKNTYFHRVIPGFMNQGGDVTEARINPESLAKSSVSGNRANPGTGGASAIGGKDFADENFFKKHKGPYQGSGMLSMANAGPNTNSSQFFLTTTDCSFLDGKHVVFGQVSSEADLAVNKKIEACGSESGATSRTPWISNTGIVEYFTAEEIKPFLVPKKVSFLTNLSETPIILNLYKNTPVTSTSFGNLAKAGKYNDVAFHRVIPNFMCQFGDVTEGRVVNGAVGGRAGTGGHSGIGLTKFADENFINKHFVGCLSMANAGRNTNGSQIFMTTAETPHLNNKHVVFGAVESDSMPTLKEVESFGSGSGKTSKLLYVKQATVLEYWDEEDSLMAQTKTGF